jgi:SAM-dependent methyltransferase
LARDLASIEFWESYHRNRGRPREVPLAIPPYRRLHRLFRSHLPNGRRRFIELGCGSSMWLSYFQATFGYEVFGLERSVLGCRNAMRNIQRSGGWARLVQGDIFRSPWRSEAFQVVFSMGLLEHFVRPDAAVAAHADLLERGGTMAVVVPNLLGVDGWLLRRTNPAVFRMHRPVSPAALKGWALQAKMEDSFVGYAGGLGLFLSMIRHRAVPPAFHAGLRRLWNGLHGLAWTCLDRGDRWPDSAVWSPFLVCIARKGGP